jgi:hypothetical protein
MPSWGVSSSQPSQLLPTYPPLSPSYPAQRTFYWGPSLRHDKVYMKIYIAACPIRRSNPFYFKSEMVGAIVAWPHAFGCGGSPKIPYVRPQPRQPDLSNRWSAWIRGRLLVCAQFQRRDVASMLWRVEPKGVSFLLFSPLRYVKEPSSLGHPQNVPGAPCGAGTRVREVLSPMFWISEAAM